jgi:putative protease
MRYSLYDESGKLIEKDRYILSKKDIFGLTYIKKLEEIGVTSLKIEGRGKTPEYVSLVTNKYRKYIDNGIDTINKKDEIELLQIFNRDGKSTGYFDSVKYKESISLNSPKNTGLILGKVIDQKKEYIKIKLEEDISMHDGIEIYDENGLVSTIVTCIKDENFKNINDDKLSGEVVWIGDISRRVNYDSVVYKTSSSKLNESLKDTYSERTNLRKVPVDIKIEISTSKKLSMEIKKSNDDVIRCELEYIPEVAINKSIDKDYVLNSLLKINDTPFVFDNIQIELSQNIFVPTSKLNELRRNALDMLYNSYKVAKDVSKLKVHLDSYLLSQEKLVKESETTNLNKNVQALYIYQYDKTNDYLKNAKYDRVYINASDYISSEADIFNKFKDLTNIYFAIPNVVNQRLEKYIDENIERLVEQGVKGILIGNIGYIPVANNLKEKYGIKIVADYSLNITNMYSILFYKNLNFDTITMSVEMQKEDIPKFQRVLDTEIVFDYVTVMTSRYCILGSFVGNKAENSKCTMPCKKQKYYLEDSHDLKYYIISDSTDCTMKLVREFYRFSKVENEYKAVTVRRCIIN